jgi:transcriptional regulator with XRE-family HTH domain
MEREEFRLVLQDELIKRCRNNTRYSLRAFAKSLDVAPSALSAILNGKRPITPKMKKRLGLAIGLSLDDLRGSDIQFTDSQTNYQQITFDAYALISDWYHYAILELVRVKDFKPDLTWISKSLGITKSEANITVERLQRLGLLEIKPNGKWVDTSLDGYATNIQDDLTSAASKKLQKQVLEMSITALEEVPVKDRNHTSMTMALNPEDLAEAKKRITTFRRELCAFLERNKKPTQVYQLGISLYPLTKIKNGENL